MDPVSFRSWSAFLALGPPGDVPFRIGTAMKTIGVTKGAILELGNFFLMSGTKAIPSTITIQPSGEDGDRPQPRRLGPNQAFFPNIGAALIGLG